MLLASVFLSVAANLLLQLTWVEIPTNPTFRVEDIPATVSIARRHPSKLQPLRRCHVESATQTILNVLREIVLRSFRYHSRRIEECAAMMAYGRYLLDIGV